MKKIYNLLRTNWKEYLTFLILFIFLLSIHFYMDYSVDDLYFQAQLNSSTLSDFLSMRYNNWSSRLIIEPILIFLVKSNINIWRVTDSILYVLGVVLSLKLVNYKTNRNFNIIGCLIFGLYPILDMNSAGWVATTTNYL